jgi:RHS repeat-associated protein
MLAIRPFASFVRYCVRKLVPVLPVLLMLVLAFGTAQAQTGVPATPDIQLPPGTNAVPPPDDPPPSSPYDSAAVVSISAPATMVAGSTANVAVTMRNTGNTVWDSGVTNPYRLGSLNPANNVTWGIGRVELVSTVEAGGQAVFNFKITAPSTPGTYSFSWGMLRELLFWFGATASSTISVTAPPPVYDAQLVSASVPTTMTAGSYYNVSLTFKNTGNVTWSQSDYRIGSTSPDDNTTWGLNRVNMSAASVAPGQSATFSFQAKAPAAAGTYLFDWGMLWELHWRFGQTSRTYVTVNPVATTPKPTVSASHTTMVAGQSFTMGWSTTNASSLTHVCTAAGTGYTVSESVAVSGSRSLTAQAGWVNYPSSCTWTASGPGGSATFTETLTTVAGTSGSVTYIYTDGLGSPVARTDASGTVISRTRYEPYGYVASGVQPTIGFTGHVNDVDTGLTYMQQRYYDPVAGRFLSIDPVVTDVNTGYSFNRYAYANNNPYSYIDPDGRAVESITVDRNNNVHIVVGMTYQGAITSERAGALNAYITSHLGGKIGKYAVNLTIIPGRQAKLGNFVTVVSGKGNSITIGNGARETTLYTQEANGASMEQAMLHEFMHLIGNLWPFDHYYSNGQAKPGWEGNIMGNASDGIVQEKNIDEIMEHSHAKERAKCGISCGPANPMSGDDRHKTSD